MHAAPLRMFGQQPAPAQPGWRTTAQDGAGEMFIAPVDAADPRNGVAWLRWCALADVAPAGAVLRELFAKTGQNLRRVNKTQLMCGAQRQHWLYPYLADNGFVQTDEIVTLKRDLSEPIVLPAANAISLRNATPADLSAIAQLDAQAFDAAWRYSALALADGFSAERIFRVAEDTSDRSDRLDPQTLSGQTSNSIVGYTFADLEPHHAHLVRIAVAPSRQRAGVGGLLLADGMNAAQKLGVTSYTLNVQTSNTTAQGLYRSFGFKRIGEPLKIMQKLLTED